MPSSSLIISYREMTSASQAGRARPLTGTIHEIMSYYGEWWTSSSDGWLRITDTKIAGCLNKIRARLDLADEN